MESDISTLVNELKKEVPQKMASSKIDGFSLAITGKTGKLWSKGFGQADHKGNTVSSQTLFMIGSLSKAYTSTAFLRAVQAGLVRLDDRLIDYYPEFNWKTRYGGDQREEVTFRHLLTHWGGLQHNANLKSTEADPIDFPEYMRRVNRMWQKYPVGTRFSYSNIGYDLVAAALQRITGQSFEDWMQEQVYEPLGMKRSTTVASQALRGSDVARGHFGGSEFSFHDTVSPQIASGTQYSSVDDMSNFISMHLNGGKVNGETFLEKSLLDEVYRIPYKDQYQLMAIGMGIGVRRFNYGGQLLLSFFGDGPGYISLHQLMPDLGIGWVMSCNQAMNSFQLMGGVAKKIEEYMVKAKLGELPSDLDVADQIPKREQVTLDADNLNRLSGKYVSRMTKIQVEHLDGSLSFKWKGEPNHLVALSGTEFTSKIIPLVKFRLDEKGRPLTLKILSSNGNTTVLDYDGGLADPEGPAKPEWDKYLGYYRRDYGVLCWYYAVSIVDGYLFLVTGGDGFRLIEDEAGMFFTSDAQSVQFTDASMILPDWVYEKEELSSELIQGLMKTDPNDIRLHKSSLDSIVSILERTGKNDDANMIKELLDNS